MRGLRPRPTEVQSAPAVGFFTSLWLFIDFCQIDKIDKIEATPSRSTPCYAYPSNGGGVGGQMGGGGKTISCPYSYMIRSTAMPIIIL